MRKIRKLLRLREQLDVAMPQVYRAGEKVFVGVLGASNHTFVDVKLRPRR